MKTLLLLGCILAANAAVVRKQCDGTEGYEIDGVFHEIETLRKDLDRPYLLTVDYSTNIVYFSYSIKGDEDSSKTARINLNTKEFADIKGVNNGFAQTVDQNTHEIYIGGSDGIYKYDYGKDQADFFAERDVNIWTVYFNKALYFSVYPSQFFFIITNGRTERFKDLEDTKVDNFVIDNDDNIFFTNATGLYSKKKGGSESVLYLEYKDTGVRGLTVDRNGKVFACLQDGIYIVDKHDVSVKNYLDIEDAFGVAYDIDNNIVYSNSTSIIRLKPNKSRSC